MVDPSVLLAPVRVRAWGYVHQQRSFCPPACLVHRCFPFTRFSRLGVGRVEDVFAVPRGRDVCGMRGTGEVDVVRRLEDRR